MSSDAERIIGLYRRHAGAWAQQRGTVLREQLWIDRFLEHLPAWPSILDIGCGSGSPIGAYLAGQGCALTGNDSSPEMIEIARETIGRGEWIVADMRGLLLDRSFDGILAWNSSFHLKPADQRRMFAVFARHAAPATVLMFTSGPAHGEAIGTFQVEALYHASLDAKEYRALLDRHGFDVVDHVVADPACNDSTVWLARYRG